MDGPILVTGGTGTVGREVVRRFRDAGHRPRVLSRRTGPGLTTGDLDTGTGLDEAVRGAAVVVHAATRPGHDVAGARQLLAALRRTGARPHVVLIHHNGLAQALAEALQEEDGPPLTILSGHDHIQHIDLYGSTLVVDAGTVGAGGILGAGKDAVGIAQLELGGAGAFPQLVDLVELEPLSGAAEAERVLPNSTAVCDHEAVECHDLDDEPPEEPVDPPEEEPEDAG